MLDIGPYLAKSPTEEGFNRRLLGKIGTIGNKAYNKIKKRADEFTFFTYRRGGVKSILGDTTTNAAESSNASNAIRDGRYKCTIDTMILVFDGLTSKISTLHQLAITNLNQFDPNTGSPSAPIEVCKEIKLKLESEMLTLFFNYDKQKACETLSELSELGDYDRDLANDSINNPLPAISAKYELNSIQVHPQGEYVQCVIKPTARWCGECNSLNYKKPGSFAVHIRPFDVDASNTSKDIYSQHTCTCHYTFSHGFVCKHISFVLFHIQKWVKNKDFRHFKFENYVWTKPCFYDVAFHTQSLFTSTNIMPASLPYELINWEKHLDALPLLPFEFKAMKQSKNHRRLNPGAVASNEGREALQSAITNSDESSDENVEAAAEDVLAADVEAAAEDVPAAVEEAAAEEAETEEEQVPYLLQQTYYMCAVDRTRIENSIINPRLCTTCFDVGHNCSKCPHPLLQIALDRQADAAQYKKIITNCSRDWSPFEFLDAKHCNPLSDWHLIASDTSDLVTYRSDYTEDDTIMHMDTQDSVIASDTTMMDTTDTTTINSSSSSSDGALLGQAEDDQQKHDNGDDDDGDDGAFLAQEPIAQSLMVSPSVAPSCNYPGCSYNLQNVELKRCTNSPCHNQLHHMCGVAFTTKWNITQDEPDRSFWCHQCNTKYLKSIARHQGRGIKSGAARIVMR